MLTSTNYKLWKPELTDVADVTFLSQNMEIIDGLIFDCNKAIKAIDVGVTTFNGKKGAVTGVSSFNGKTGEIKGVNSVNGKTGDVTVVESIQGKTGNIDLLDLVHPIGSIYISLSPTNPEVLFGGKWEQIKGRFLLSADTSYKAGTTGGEVSHTLTIDEMPYHQHGGVTGSNGSHSHTRGTMNITGSFLVRNNRYYKNNDYKEQGAFYEIANGLRSEGNADDNRLDKIYGFDASRTWTGATSAAPSHQHTINAEGGNKAHNNMPPYLVTYMWQRVA